MARAWAGTAVALAAALLFALVAYSGPAAAHEERSSAPMPSAVQDCDGGCPAASSHHLLCETGAPASLASLLVNAAEPPHLAAPQPHLAPASPRRADGSRHALLRAAFPAPPAYIAYGNYRS